MWKIEKIVNNGVGRYLYAVVPGYPNNNKKKYVYHHRVVMENYLSRRLRSDEIVHHKDGNKQNNSIENLELMLRKEHTRQHQLEIGVLTCLFKCPECSVNFERARNNTHLVKPCKTNATFCSVICRGLFSKKIQMHGITDKMQRNINRNVIKMYRIFKV